MVKNIIKLQVLVIVVLSFIVGLTSCNTFNLKLYQKEAKADIDSYAQAIPYAEIKKAIHNIIVNKKRAIDEATTKDRIDKLVVSTKEAIDKLTEERIKPMDGAEEYDGGDGTKSAPYIISTKGQLIYFSNQINRGENTNAYFVLGTDLDLDGIEWMPIGIVTEYNDDGNCFHGVFDGKGYEISNFIITTRQKNTNAENIGLFGYNVGTICNLGVVNFKIDITWQYKWGNTLSIMAGGLTGSNFGDVINCFALGDVNLEYYGGATITSPAHINVGGIVGYNSSEAIISNCFSVVEINAQYSNEVGTVCGGGLAGVNNGEVNNCLAIEDVNIEHFNQGIGGEAKAHALFGKLSSTQTLKNCYWYENLMVNGLVINVDEANCTAMELSLKAFYLDKLGWDVEVWSLDDLDFLNRKYPSLMH